MRPLSVYSPGDGVCISTPVVLGSGGIMRSLPPLELNPMERTQWVQSVRSLRAIIDKYEPMLRQFESENQNNRSDAEADAKAKVDGGL